MASKTRASRSRVPRGNCRRVLDSNQGLRGAGARCQQKGAAMRGHHRVRAVLQSDSACCCVIHCRLVAVAMYSSRRCRCAPRLSRATRSPSLETLDGPGSPGPRVPRRRELMWRCHGGSRATSQHHGPPPHGLWCQREHSATDIAGKSSGQPAARRPAAAAVTVRRRRGTGTVRRAVTRRLPTFS